MAADPAIREDWDVIVIGAGIAGASVAFELAGSRRVLILEQEQHPGAHSTGRSAAVFIEPYGNEVVQALTAASRPFFEEPPPGFCDVPLLGARELYQVATEKQGDALRETFEALSPTFPALRFAPASEVEERIPLLRRDLFVAAMHDPRTMDIDVAALHQGFLTGAARSGARLLTGARVHGLVHTSAGWEATTAAGFWRAPIVIDAAGAWAGEIGRMGAASPVPLRALQRSMVVVDPGPDADVRQWPLVADIGEAWYFKPESGLLLGSPSEEDEMEPCNAAPDDLAIATGVDRLEQALDLRVGHVERSWAGLRTFATDRTPVVGFDPEVEGFFWLAGQGGFGIQTAPAMGRLAANLVLGNPVPEDLLRREIGEETVGPRRFFA